MRKVNVAFDLDGCVVDSGPAIFQCVQELYGVKRHVSEARTFGLEEFFEITRDQVDRVLGLVFKKWELLRPVYGALEFLKEYYYLRNPNHKKRHGNAPMKYKPLEFITARKGNDTKRATMEWLTHYLHPIPFNLSFTNDIGKPEILYDKCIDIYIEDRAKYAQEIADVYMKVLLIDKPYNRHLDCESNDYLLRVSDWKEIRDIIKGGMKD